MRPRYSWADLADVRVGVWGLGAEGRATERRLRALGVEPVLVDDRPTDARVLATADGGLDALAACDVVVKSPGISRRRTEMVHLRDEGVAIVGGLGLWLESTDLTRVLCVTGTKGKSTTVSIAAHLAEGLGLHAVAAGNLGVVPWDPDRPGPEPDLWAIEVSSYQAADLTCAPPVVAVTSLSPDHLPWHGDVDDYYRDKLSMCRLPGARVSVAASTSAELLARVDQLGPEVRWIGPGRFDPAWAEPLGLVGRHNLVNAHIARACLVEMGVDGADDDLAATQAAHGFRGLDARLEVVASIAGVDFVDDGLATNVLPTIAAVDSFDRRRVALIAGGEDRGIDYAPLADAIARRDEPILVLAVYSTGPRIRDAVEARGGDVVECHDLADAVRRGYEWARPDGVVLLSPAAPSFDAFSDYRDRGRAFRAAIDELH